MSKSLEIADSDNIDSERVYCTNALIKKVGRAVAVSLSDATLPGTAKNKHMTILFRAGKRWRDDEIELISKETDNWIKQKYGSNKAPVTFSISLWGNKSVKIDGDLYTLCLHLRQIFGSMSNDKQRIPHCELFVNHRKNNNHNKSCHICGELGHFKKDCPQKQYRKHSASKKGRIHGKKGGNNGNSEKIEERLQRMIGKMQELKKRKQREIQLLDEEEKELQELLNNADNLDNKSLRDGIKNIAKSFKNKRKEFKGRRNNKIKRKRKYKNKSFKQCKPSKEERKELNKKRRESKKLQREERKRLKKEKFDKLTAARLEILPSNKTEIGDNDILYIYVDGYNIIGCDSNCRRNMRGKGGGMKKSRSRLAKLLQNMFINKFNDLKLDYKPIVYLWFDGNGKNHKYGDIEITFSTKKQIVDDKLVEKFSKNDKKQNSNILVITTDKELTLRLYDIGVKVMKSSTFYKTHLKEKEKENIAVNPTDDNDDNDDNDDEKKEEYTEDTNDNNADDDFVQVIANKIMQNEDEDTTEGDYGDYDEGDYTPDEVEGGHFYQTPGNDEEDYEFTSIFGEEFEEMDINDFD